MYRMSIIIPVYNAQRTIERTLKSVLEQMNNDIELIIVDDGSTDQSANLIKKLIQDKSNIKFYKTENRGVSQARNYGLIYSTAEWITFLDSDDYYEPNALNTILNNLNQNIDLVIFEYYVKKENHKKEIKKLIDKSFKDKYDFRENSIYLIKDETLNAPWNKVYRRSIIISENIIFPPKVSIGEDLFFNIDYIKHISNVMLINNPLINYCIDSGEGLILSFRLDRLKIRLNIIDKLRALYKYWDINSAIIEKVLTEMEIKDYITYFMDFFKPKCSLSFDEKIYLVRKNISSKRCFELLYRNVKLGKILWLVREILRTKNSYFILFCAKLFNQKRKIR